MRAMPRARRARGWAARTACLPRLSICRRSVGFAEPVVDEGRQRSEGRLRLWAGRLQVDGRAGAGGKRHQPHDGRAANALAVLADRDLAVEAFGAFDEARGGAGVQAASVDDCELTRCRPVHPCARSFEATLMYLR